MASGITNRQMVFILFLTLTSVSIIEVSKSVVEHAGAGGWFTIIIAAFLFGLAAAMLASLNNMFQGKVLFDYSREIVGRAGSIIIGAYYFIYFLIISAFLCSSMSNVLSSNFLLKTPAWATTLIGLPFYGYAAYKGITNVGRIFELYGIVFLVVAVFVHVIMFLNGKVEYILPLFNPAELPKYVSALKYNIIPFLGVEVLTIIPFVNKNNKNAPKTAFWTVIGIGLFYVLVVETCVMTIGINEIVHYNNPLIAAIRQVEVPFLDFLRRMDLLYLTIGFLGIFAGKTIVYTAVVEFGCKLFPKVKRWVMVIEVGVAIMILVLIFLDINKFGQYFGVFGAVLGIIATAFIPALLLMIAKVKKRVEKNR